MKSPPSPAAWILPCSILTLFCARLPSREAPQKRAGSGPSPSPRQLPLLTPCHAHASPAAKITQKRRIQNPLPVHTCRHGTKRGCGPFAKEPGQDTALGGAFAILIFPAGLPACLKIADASGLARAARSIASLQRHGGERIWATSHHGYPGWGEVCRLRGGGCRPLSWRRKPQHQGSLVGCRRLPPASVKNQLGRISDVSTGVARGELRAPFCTPLRGFTQGKVPACHRSLGCPHHPSTFTTPKP